jgi:hypothetical protein
MSVIVVLNNGPLTDTCAASYTLVGTQSQRPSSESGNGRGSKPTAVALRPSRALPALQRASDITPSSVGSHEAVAVAGRSPPLTTEPAVNVAEMFC